MSRITTEQKEWAKQDFRKRLSSGQAPDAIREDLRNSLVIMAGLDPDFAGKVIEELERELHGEAARIRTLGGATLSGGEVPEWYLGPQKGDRLWPNLERRLLEVKEWDDETVASIGTTSTGVVSRLYPPAMNEFSGRGLVVGYVQSGKTANMTAVIAKAVDEGYRLVIVLAGTTDSLRLQTQKRMEEDLVNIEPHYWDLLTSEGSDFNPGARRRLTVPKDGAILAIVKKNTHILARFRDFINETGKATLTSLPALVIDDETDQASPDVSNQDDGSDPSAINLRIREILNNLPAVSYVGYTATPFANVLINPASQGNGTSFGDDLYPKDFIVALPIPNGYMGAEAIFGRNMTSADEVPPDEEGINAVRDIPDDDLLHLNEMKEKDELPVPPTLDNALTWFLLSAAARQTREASHCTMLVHTSRLTDAHGEVCGAIQRRVDQLKDFKDADLRSLLQSVWDEEYPKINSERFGNSDLSFGDVYPSALKVLGQLRVVEDNYVSKDQVEFPDDGDPVWAIITGGDRLARGVTLPGLLVSYFARNTAQYDTLLQMGRWFGFRRGYEELPRIWMPVLIKGYFRELATIEQEIREEIAVYANTPMTPLDWGVRIRQVSGMLITRRPAMQHAKHAHSLYSGEHIQTLRFYHKDGEWLARNWEAGSQLIGLIESNGIARINVSSGILWEGVAVSEVLQFLERYQTSDEQVRTKTADLRNYIEKYAEGHLAKWNVGLITTQDGELSENVLGPLGHVKTVGRSKTDESNTVPAYIKALMSKADILMDAGVSLKELDSDAWAYLKQRRAEAQSTEHRPLLLLYPIYRDSKARTATRYDLQADGDVLGFGMVFPDDPHGFSGHYVRGSLNEVMPSADGVH